MTKLAEKAFQAGPTVVRAGEAAFGGGHFTLIAGPCAVESEEQLLSVARAVKEAGADMLRGGAFKPRTSPYTFHGLGAEGIRFLLEAKKETGLPVVTELTDLKYLELFGDVDVIQVGARNMQHFEMLKELGHCRKPILLKRGMANTVEELLDSAEYILSGGNGNVILCERGIRTFEPGTRFTLDLSAVPALHAQTHLPVIVDPSHAAGDWHLVRPMALAAVAAGADGVMVEVHNRPDMALSDGHQSVTPERFRRLAEDIRCLRATVMDMEDGI